MSCKPRQLNKFLSLLSVSLGGTLSFGAFCVNRGDENFYSNILMPLATRLLDPEVAHEACIFLTKHKLISCQDKLKQEQANKLKTKVFNLSFANPIGVAAGFDKNSDAVPGLNLYGLGFAEVGTVTPKPQAGNPKKRIFRFVEDKALINRCGFNNKGMDYVMNNLASHNSFHPMLLGLNIGKNKETEHISSDYTLGLEKARNITSIDYLVINISSPNTVGLRSLQDKRNLENLLDDVLTKMDSLSIDKPLLVKIAPDLTERQLQDVADVLIKKKCGSARVSGVILTNTTVSRPENCSSSGSNTYQEIGGLSGVPLRDMSTKVIRDFYRMTKGQIPIVGVGGVSSGQDAFDKIKAGASLIQLYTGLTFEGPPIVNKIKRELVELLERDKLSSITEAVGIDHR